MRRRRCLLLVAIDEFTRSLWELSLLDEESNFTRATDLTLLISMFVNNAGETRIYFLLGAEHLECNIETRMQYWMDKSLSDGIFSLELLSFVQHRAVNWGLVTKGVIGSRDWSYFSITSRFEVTSL
ncbi:hypothetical protein P8452_00813 [Trifolium repens]|nr:hypothetical protein P8452_00813 [Trifolium repens]